MAISVSIPKGTRDFSPEVMFRRKYIFSVIEEAFNLFGYAPIETPSLENLSTLTGKYGEEGDRLIFKILNSGNFLEGIEYFNTNDTNPARLAARICEKALRYDLTVPFARYVVMNRNSIVFPFKRYQIQPVWRADRPQKGRYREFYQCDADVIGSNSLLNELELIQLIDLVFRRLNINVTIKINNRKILTAISELIGKPDKITDITVAIDKIEKTGKEKVVEELIEKGLTLADIAKIEPVFELNGSNYEKISGIGKIIGGFESGKAGIQELTYILDLLKTINLSSTVEIDYTLARGLNYYTGAIIEVKANHVSIGSICGGGRYDNLTGIFGLPDISGVGISFGADRIYDVMNELNLFPSEAENSTRVMYINFGGNEETYAFRQVAALRAAGIACELFPEASKLKKQFAYADNRKIPFVVIAGSKEIEENLLVLKEMNSGTETKLSFGQLLEEIKKH